MLLGADSSIKDFMPAYRKFNQEDIWEGTIVAKPYIFYSSGSFGITGSILLNPESQVDKATVGWEGGNIRTDKITYNKTGSIQLTKISLTGSLDDQRYRTTVNLLNWHYTRDVNYAPLTSSGGPLIGMFTIPPYDGTWTTGSLAANIASDKLYLIDISNVYHGDEICDGSFALFLTWDMISKGDPRDRSRYYDWINSDAVLVYAVSGGLFTGSAQYIEYGKAERLHYNVSASEAALGQKKVGYALPEGLWVISDNYSCANALEKSYFLGKSGRGNMILNLYGKHTFPTKMILCRAPMGKCNASNNPSFYLSGSDGGQHLSGSDGTTVVTKIGLYNKTLDLIGVANLAQPVFKKPEDDVMFKVRIDF